MPNGLRSRKPLCPLSQNCSTQQTVSRRIRSKNRNAVGGNHDTDDIFWKLPPDSYPDKLRTLDNGDIAKFELQRKRGACGNIGLLENARRAVPNRHKKQSDIEALPPPPPPFPRMHSTKTSKIDIRDDVGEEICLAPRASTTLGFGMNKCVDEIPKDYTLSGTLWRKQGKMFRRWRKCHAYMNAIHLAISPRSVSGVIQIKNQEQIILRKSTCIRVGRAQAGRTDGLDWVFHLYTENGLMYAFATKKEESRETWVNNLNAAARTHKYVEE